MFKYIIFIEPNDVKLYLHSDDPYWREEIDGDYVKLVTRDQAYNVAVCY